MQISISSGDSITAVQSAAVTTTAPTAKVDYNGKPSSKTAMTALSGVTPVTLLTGPISGERLITHLSIYNGDAVAQTITLKHVISGTSYTILAVTLAIGDTLIIDGNGVQVIDANGQQKVANAATVPVVLTGPLTGLIGDSTAAAGTTVADAGALPAGTGNIYPTTAADDTTGVVIDVADQVTGRILWIGNGVSNKILKVYGPSGAVINGAAADAAFSSASGKGVVIVCLSGAGNTWLAW